LLPPKDTDPPTLRLFSCKPAVSRGRRKGVGCTNSAAYRIRRDLQEDRMSAPHTVEMELAVTSEGHDLAET